MPGLLPDVMGGQVSGPVDQVNRVVRSDVLVHRLDRAQGGVTLSVVSPPSKEMSVYEKNVLQNTFYELNLIITCPPFGFRNEPPRSLFYNRGGHRNQP